MVPSLIFDNAINCCPTYRKPPSKFHSADTVGKEIANFFNLIFSQFALTVLYALRTISIFAAPIINILYVLFLISQIQMVRIATGRIITFVQNLYPFWYLSISEFIRNSMSGLDFAFEGKSAITKIMPGFTGPFPTFINIIGLIYPVPECSFRCFVDRWVFSEQRVTVSEPPQIMLLTPASTNGGIVTVWNRARRIMSSFVEFFDHIWIAISPPTPIMHITPSTSYDNSLAFQNRACSFHGKDFNMNDQICKDFQIKLDS